jgi:hypothetical protein
LPRKGDLKARIGLREPWAIEYNKLVVSRNAGRCADIAIVSHREATLVGFINKLVKDL